MSVCLISKEKRVILKNSFRGFVENQNLVSPDPTPHASRSIPSLLHPGPHGSDIVVICCHGRRHGRVAPARERFTLIIDHDNRLSQLTTVQDFSLSPSLPPLPSPPNGESDRFRKKLQYRGQLFWQQGHIEASPPNDTHMCTAD